MYKILWACLLTTQGIYAANANASASASATPSHEQSLAPASATDVKSRAAETEFLEVPRKIWESDWEHKRRWILARVHSQGTTVIYRNDYGRALSVLANGIGHVDFIRSDAYTFVMDLLSRKPNVRFMSNNLLGWRSNDDTMLGTALIAAMIRPTTYPFWEHDYNNYRLESANDVLQAHTPIIHQIIDLQIEQGATYGDIRREIMTFLSFINAHAKRSSPRDTLPDATFNQQMLYSQFQYSLKVFEKQLALEALRYLNRLKMTRQAAEQELEAAGLPRELRSMVTSDYLRLPQDEKKRSAAAASSVQTGTTKPAK